MKLRRDITLGEMQDECSFRGHNCETIGGEPCKHYAICNQIRTKSCTPPEDWDLSDPPRFTEAQMAFFRWWNERGAVKAVITHYFEYGAIVVFEDAIRRQIGNVQEASIVAAVKENGETIDLAELLGKDAI